VIYFEVQLILKREETPGIVLDPADAGLQLVPL